MLGGLRTFALVVALLATAVACGRGDEEIARLRQAVEAEMAAAPLPQGAELVRGRFDKGCHDFWECADGPDRPAVYEADLYLGRPPSSTSSMCAYFVGMLRDKGFRLAGEWDDKRFEVDAAACAAGHPGAGTVVRADGKSFSAKATLEFSLLDDRGVVAPHYKLTYEPHEPLSLNAVRLTRSVVAHIRGALDREFVLSAAPEADGITSGQTRGPWWKVPSATTSLRFEVTCDERDEAWLDAHDPDITGKPYGWGRRVVRCTGAATVVDVPVELKKDKATVRVSVYGRPASAQRQPSRNGDYVVRFLSAS
ncbi:hypothetical protein [Lentzea flava]|uniref:Uncharacterized protein n=1 Tax=Lentzea flava TaxID=103732 RepID=A0ABQ2UJC9_9PSEU|nr:hypothetical protein [Lentzea flava]MCP2199820.1 hypothetical protein [Lentzea flava]GGU40574.1 hypothetical protein GCM10010178_36420 [Lentzea flava]